MFPVSHLGKYDNEGKNDTIEKNKWADNPQYYFEPKRDTFLYVRLSINIDGMYY